MASEYLVTTTGTLNPVVFNDLGGRTLDHPTVDLDLFLEYSKEEISRSADVQAALDAGHITVKDENDNPITSADIIATVNASGVVGELPAVQVRRTTNQTLTTSYADIVFDTTDVQNESGVVERSIAFPERILINEAGLYQVSYQCSVDADSTERTIDFRVRKNGTDTIPGSERQISEDDEINDIGSVFLCNLVEGDYITFQAQATGGTIPLLPPSVYTVVKLQGTKGEQGQAGSGSSITVRDENVAVAGTPHSILDFQGDGVSVANAGGGRAVVTISQTTPVFGQDFQTAESSGRSTTTSGSFQTKTTLTTPALTGTYRVGWSAVVDQSSTNSRVVTRLRNTTDNTTIGAEDEQEMKDTNNMVSIGGFGFVTFTGASKTFEIQWRSIGSMSGIQAAIIEFWRVS